MALQDEYLVLEQILAIGDRTPSAIYSERYRGVGLGALAVKVGKRLVWRRSDVERWFEEQRQKAAEGRR